MSRRRSRGRRFCRQSAAQKSRDRPRELGGQSKGRFQPILAKYGAADRPLKIGGIEIPCYVLADGTRVLAQRGLQSGIGLSEGGANPARAESLN